LKGAYYEQAKVLHPDISGPAGKEDFKALLRRYEAATRLLELHATKPCAEAPSDSQRRASRRSEFVADRNADRVLQARRQARVAPERAIFELFVMTSCILAGGYAGLGGVKAADGRA